ncbi:hypothetical protein LX64_03616 [Chitinophaga skermanii]|uniref:Uncharacterized protein n=1 Tax=Chitinophaga skermanii TaxID=331697 RepID=A0A327QD61_9BACT|nr:DUF6702 family protein [Chitinophaga skermanii]RAJ02596.1 hypothetical protein LX64_03616 [Chitinophaga skermanii]
MGLLLCKWLFPVWLLGYHPFYVSVTEIKHNAAAKSLEVSNRIFYDDLERGIKNQYHVNFDIMKPANRPQVDSLISKYIQSHFSVTVDGRNVSLKYLGYQIEEDAAWCFFEGANVPAAKKVQVKTDILYAEHKEQINMLHVIVNGNRKSTKLDYPNTIADINF